VRNGIVAKREYRGKRDVDAFIKFVQEQTTDPITEYADLGDIRELDVREMELKYAFLLNVL